MIETLKTNAIISGAFGNLDSLASANALEKYNMMVANNYYDGRLNPTGPGIDNEFELQRGDSVVYDAATGLTWQQLDSPNPVRRDEAELYIKELNSGKHAGYSDWRLPTLEEAMSLMEPPQENVKKGPHINPVFNETQFRILTSDKFTGSRARFVDFIFGYCFYDLVFIDYFVRAVR